MDKLTFVFFRTAIITIRLNVILANVEKGNRGRAIKLIEDCIFHLEHNDCESDLSTVWREKATQLLLELELMIMCGSNDIHTHIDGIRDVVLQNRWYTSEERWPVVMASRLMKGGDVGSLSALPFDILESIAGVVSS